MFCKKCGAEIDDERVLCDACAAEETETQEEVTSEEQPIVDEQPAPEAAQEAPVETPPASPAKKSKAPVIIIAVVIAVLAVVGVLLFVFWDTLFGATEPPEDQTQQTQQTTTLPGNQPQNSTGGSSVGSLQDLLDRDASVDGKMTLELETLALQMLGADVPFDELSVNYTLDYISRDKLAVIVDTDVATAEMYLDFTAKTITMALPGLDDDAIQMNVADLSPEAAQAFEMIANGDASMFTEDSAAVYAVAAEELTKLLGELVPTDNVTSVTVEGVTEEQYYVEISLTDTQIRDAVVAIMETLKTDEGYKNMLMEQWEAMPLEDDELEMTAEEYYAQTVEAMDQTIADLKAQEVSDEVVVSAKVYFSKDLDVRGAEGFFVIGQEGNKIHFSCQYAQNGGQCAVALSVKANDSEIVGMNGKGTISADNAVSMPVTVELNDTAFLTLTVENWKHTDAACSGKVTIQPEKALVDLLELSLPASLTDQLSVSLEVDADADKSKTVLSVNVAGVSYATLTNEVTFSEEASVTMPENVTTDRTAWDDLSVDVLYERLEEAGIPIPSHGEEFGEDVAA